MSILSAKNLVKKFGDTTAVDGVSLDIEAGEIFGFLGPNGAGKTTTIRLLTGALSPDDGTIEIFGMRYDDNAIAIKRQIGVVPDEPPSFKNLRGWEFLKFIASIYRCEKDVFHRVDELCELLKIDFLDEYTEAHYVKRYDLSVLN